MKHLNNMLGMKHLNNMLHVSVHNPEEIAEDLEDVANTIEDIQGTESVHQL